MNRIKPVLFTLIFASVLMACNRNPLKVDISNCKKNIEIVRFDNDLFSIQLKDTLKEISELSNKYPGFFDLFTYRIIRIGGVGDEEFTKLLASFVTDTMILNVKNIAEKKFSDFKKTEKQLNKAFKYYQYHFPKKELPTVYVYISGFNQSVVTAENIIGISLDKYLGRDCRYYKQLSTAPQYKILNMRKEKIVSDVAYAWASAEFGDKNEATNLIGNMIHQGKLMYFVDALLPDTPDSLKIGYTTKQFEFCINNEAEMWQYLVEKKMLFSNKRMDIIRYINDGPTTSGFPRESPARAGIWIGWQIVRQYMKKFPETTLKQLMKNNDYQQILNDSEYLPE
jgi:gliding motility-associated lipoprotein GldB